MLVRTTGAPQAHHHKGQTHFSVGTVDGGYLSILAGDLDHEHHYVEIDDQAFGEANCLVRFEVASDARSVTLTFNFDFQRAGRVFTFESDEPMDPQTAQWARAFGAEIAARR